MFSPELTLLRQGEGRIEAPYPPVGSAELAGTPALFIGVVERTYRAGLQVSGREGPFELSADAGIHRVVNVGHAAGVSDTRIEARMQATIGLDWWGEIRE